ncbi:23S rRNA (pseudouridine(1915)-N(3))-methyltransferase RlmH [Hyphomonas sp.]|uniref:23S rRNA (pseudouridine(1915)-N(3))-methyltransferase RlmH n=1 Tax=Hyphomonas sp. TaxID=87 RepID=UPI00391D1D4D
MHLRILAVGRLKDGPERVLCDDYIRRASPLARGLGFRSVEELEVPSGGGLDTEGRRLSEKIAPGVRAIRLDEHGEALSSEDFARRLAGWRDDGIPAAVFMIGGAEGYSDALRRAVPATLAFGVQTWPHRLVRAMLAEQIYRAMTILAGTPYHKA